MAISGAIGGGVVTENMALDTSILFSISNLSVSKYTGYSNVEIVIPEKFKEKSDWTF